MVGSTMLLVRLLAAALALTALSCASTPTQTKKPKPPEAPESVTPSMEVLEAQILAQTKETAAAEMGCPADQLLARCTKHDSHGGCVSIHVTGCEKTMEYQFGEE
jgi:hypothetical protein